MTPEQFERLAEKYDNGKHTATHWLRDVRALIVHIRGTTPSQAQPELVDTVQVTPEIAKVLKGANTK